MRSQPVKEQELLIKVYACKLLLRTIVWVFFLYDNETMYFKTVIIWFLAG